MHLRCFISALDICCGCISLKQLDWTREGKWKKGEEDDLEDVCGQHGVNDGGLPSESEGIERATGEGEKGFKARELN